ncbi:hypothetical protein Tco_0163110 [Tanacetum coccineum]
MTGEEEDSHEIRSTKDDIGQDDQLFHSDYTDIDSTIWFDLIFWKMMLLMDEAVKECLEEYWSYFIKTEFVCSLDPWFSCENNGSSAREGGPSPEWTRLFWKSFSSLADLPLFSDLENAVTHWGLDDDDVANMDSLSQEFQPYMLDFNVIGKKYPWLYSLLNQCNIPVVDAAFMDCAPPLAFLPTID